MPLNAEAMKPPLHDQITEMQRKIQLLGESSHKPCYRLAAVLCLLASDVTVLPMCFIRQG